MPRKTISNWGRFPVVEADITESADIAKTVDLVRNAGSLIARGNGRCYGDASLGENIFSTLRLDHFISFDTESGVIECESGVMLAEILKVSVPRGFFLPVTPGTKFITVGGAVAADVHGKNHHCEGGFSDHIVELSLITTDGTIIRCSPSENSEIFWQTCGGMGLTGIILSVKFRLKPIETAYISQNSYKAKSIDSVMKLFDETADSTYAVAWIDCFAKGSNLGRSLLMIGEHTTLDELPAKYANDPLSLGPDKALAVPFDMPSSTVNRLTVKMLNFTYYHKQLRKRTESVVHFEPYFYPLDGIHNWNRAYGKQGFLQYQLVLPLSDSMDGLVKILEKIERSGQGSPLAVLKLFGDASQNAVMSFPIKGYTLALDFKVNDRVFKLLDELDELVLSHGGRIYLAKDSRMSAETFHRSYSKKVNSGKFRSLQSERLKN